jgi:hypothetical protein
MEEEAPGVEEAFLNTRSLEIKGVSKDQAQEVLLQRHHIKYQNYALHRENKMMRCKNKEIVKKMGISVATSSKGNSPLQRRGM